MATTFDRTYVDADGYEHRYAVHEHGDGEEVECICCGAMVPGCTDCPNAPPADDDDAWTEMAGHHAPGCEWIRTRAHRLD